MIKISDNCTGCRACEQLCPTHSIVMTADAEGFLQPKINEEECIQCNKCKNRCASLRQSSKGEFLQKTYAVVNKDSKILKSSSSGGVFFGIAKAVIQEGGFVYGCSFNSALEAVHIEVNTIKALSRIQGSKYVQSDTGDTYRKVQERLNEGASVLYTGTPCQIDGLYSYLGKSYEKLFTMDVICHGVPSPLLFKKYLLWLSEKYHDEVKSINFRSKHEGWKLLLEVRMKHKTRYINPYLDPYYLSFLQSDTYRESCYKCKYASTNRVSDITVGDFWGGDSCLKNISSNQGLSAVIINSPKGADLFECIKNDVLLEETTMELIARENHNLSHPSARTSKRDNIYKQINELPEKIYFKNNFKVGLKLKKRIIILIPYKFRCQMKKILKKVRK